MLINIKNILKSILFFSLLFPLLVHAGALPELDCIINPNQTIELSSSENGVVDKVYVDKGDKVSRGQRLLELESSVEKATVALARLHANMEHEINSKRANLYYAKRKSARFRTLYNKKAASLAMKDEAETEELLAKIELYQAKQNKQSVKLELERSVKKLNRRRLRSPIAGVVMERYISPGESVKDKKLIKLAQLDPLRVDVIVPADFFGRIKRGMQAKIIPEISPANSYLARVNIVDKVIDASSGTFDVRLKLQNPGYKLAAGVKCKVRFDEYQHVKQTIKNRKVSTVKTKPTKRKDFITRFIEHK